MECRETEKINRGYKHSKLLQMAHTVHTGGTNNPVVIVNCGMYRLPSYYLSKPFRAPRTPTIAFCSLFAPARNNLTKCFQDGCLLASWLYFPFILFYGIFCTAGTLTIGLEEWLQQKNSGTITEN